MSVSIRRSSSADYPALVAIYNAAYPNAPTTVARLQDDDAHPNPKLRSARWVATLDGQPVGIGEYSQSSDLYHPRKFRVLITVAPEHQRQGLGRLLYEHVTRALEPFAPIALQARAHEDERATLDLLAARGFVEHFRVWESQLAAADVDLGRWDGLEQRLAGQGIMIVLLEELPATAERDRRLYELECATTADVLSPVTVEMISYERYVERILRNPEIAPYLVAVRADEPIGLSYGRSQPDQTLDIEMTGVTRPYRRQGVATALKLRGIAYARQHGYHTIRTWNDTINQPILALNQQLGFVRQPALIFFEKPLAAEADGS